MDNPASALLLKKAGQSATASATRKGPVLGMPLTDRFPSKTVRELMEPLLSGMGHEPGNVFVMAKFVDNEKRLTPYLRRLFGLIRESYALRDALKCAKTDLAITELRRSMAKLAIKMKKMLGKIKNDEHAGSIAEITKTARHGIALCRTLGGVCQGKLNGKEGMCTIAEKNLLDIVRRQAFAKGLKIDHEYEPLAPIRSHVLYLPIIISNIMSNSRRAMEDVKEKTIHLSTCEKQGFIVLQLTDNGCGMTDQQVLDLNAGIGESTKKAELHGEGFRYCQKLARLTGGDLYVKKSIVGKGTSVCLKLPLAQESQIMAEAANF